MPSGAIAQPMGSTCATPTASTTANRAKLAIVNYFEFAVENR
jgi:hypothetical protein